MNSLFQAILLTGLLTIGAAFLSAENDLEKGIAAFENQEYEKAIKLIKPLAEQGTTEAQYFMGVIYWYSTDREPRINLAQKWFKRAFDQWYIAAEDGDLDSMVDISLMYQSGLGVNINEKKAKKWLERAVEGGSPRAFAIKGDICLEGIWSKSKKGKAMYWYRKAADCGNEYARQMLKILEKRPDKHLLPPLLTGGTRL